MLEETQVSNEEQVASQTPDEEPELDLNLEEDEPKAEDPSSNELEQLKAKMAELESKNKQLYARLKKEAEAEKKPNTNSQPEGDLDWKRKIEFVTTKGRSLDAEDIDEVIAYAKGKNIPYEQALDSSVIKSYLKVKQAKAKIANAIPPSSSKSSVINGKSWSQMNEQERAANFSKMMRKR